MGGELSILVRSGVKICGLRDVESITVAAEAGAAFVGLIFYPPSPRAVTAVEARSLTDHAHVHGVPVVGVFVDPDDGLLGDAVDAGIDLIQLHGDEDVERISDVKSRFGLPVIKAIKVATADDLVAAESFGAVADYLLLDARPPKDAVLPGGNGEPFDWGLLADWQAPTPWFLSGGLSVDNLAQALAATGACLLDVSSGVEQAPGQKDPTLMRAFLAKAGAGKA